MIEYLNKAPLPIVEIPSPATPETLTGIAADLPRGQSFDFRIKQLDDILNFPEYPLTINLKSRAVISNNTAVAATEIEFGILRLLAMNADTPLSKEEILYQAWGDIIDIQPHTLDVHNSNLRKKVAEVLPIPYPIRTIRRFGLVFDTIPVTKID